MWRSEDHTADACLYVEAGSWHALLEEAVRAFGEWMLADDTARPKSSAEHVLRIEGTEATELWVRLWRGLHRAWVVGGLLSTSGRVRASGDNPLELLLTVCAAGDIDTGRLADVKAVTWHGAEIGRTETGLWYGRIVLDI